MKKQKDTKLFYYTKIPLSARIRNLEEWAKNYPVWAETYNYNKKTREA